MPEESALRLRTDYLWLGTAAGQLAQLRFPVLLYGSDPSGTGFLVRREKIMVINLSTPE